MNRHIITTMIAATTVMTTLFLSGCTDHTEPEARSTVSRTDDRAEVIRIFQTAVAAFDADGWEIDADWFDCSDVVPESVRYSFFASQRTPLRSTPEATIREVAQRMTDAGYAVAAQHETSGDLWAVGYPNGFLGGRADDGSGFDVTVAEGRANIDIDGHCVPGDIPTDPADPLNATPSPSDEQTEATQH
jgi:hypothetical protein